MGATPVRRYYTAKAIAEMFSVKEATVRLWLRSGKLSGFRLPNGTWRISPDDLEEYVRKRYEE